MHEYRNSPVRDRLDDIMELNSMMMIVLFQVLLEGRIIMSELDDLATEVGEIKTIAASAKALIVGLKQALDAAGTDPAKLAALRADLDASGNDLAAAIAENTPAAPPEPPV